MKVKTKGPKLKFEVVFSDHYKLKAAYNKKTICNILKKVEALFGKNGFLLQQEKDILKTGIALNSKALVSVLFCDDSQMRAYQKQYRKLDRTTDVLSFPSHEGWQPGLEVSNNWGDLIVSMPTVVRGSKRVRRTWQKELSEVVVHGVLHLLGMDHVKSANRAKRMKTLQKKLISQI